jgi:hypothetical protein
MHAGSWMEVIQLVGVYKIKIGSVRWLDLQRVEMEFTNFFMKIFTCRKDEKCELRSLQ